MGTTRQLEGAIDHISSGMRIQGWARDIVNPFATIRIGIVAGDRLIATGDANGFRRDLFDSDVGHGWYGFALRPTKPTDWASVEQLHLIDVEARALIGSFRPPLPESFEGHSVDLRRLDLSMDEYLVDVSHLRGFAPLLDRYVADRGAETFVDHGYCFILGRAADPDGLKSYSREIEEGHLRPLDFLRVLLESDEAQRSRRRLPTPLSKEFPFRFT